MTSWNIDTFWPDLDQWRRKAEVLAASGVNAVTLFWFGKGKEYRHIIFDSAIYERTHPECGFERTLEVLSLACTVCHEAGLRVIEHHGFAFVHYQQGHEFYRIPLDELDYRGEPMRDWACVDARSGGRTMGEYQGYVFCPNNRRFREASADLVSRMAVSGIDGMMLDDISFMPSWYVCVCPECREGFGQRYHADIPPPEDATFWGNFENLNFRNWLQFRLDSTTEYHRFQAERLAKSKRELLYYACNSSVLGPHAAQSQGTAYDGWIEAANVVHLENVNWRVNQYSFHGMVAEQKVDHAVARPREAGSLNLLYPHSEKDYFHCWAQTKWMGSSFWGSYSHFICRREKGAPAELITPEGKEEEVVGRCYAIEKEYPEFFSSSLLAASRIIVVFSPATRNFHGGNHDQHYTGEFNGWCQALVEANLPFNVVLEGEVSAEGLRETDLLILPHWACMSEAAAEAVRSYVVAGGRVIATGATSLYDEAGTRRKEFALTDVLGLAFRAEVGDEAFWIYWAPEALTQEIPERPRGGLVLAQAREGTQVQGRWLREVACNDPILREGAEVWRYDAAVTFRETGEGRMLWLGFKPGLSVMRRVLSMHGWRPWSFVERVDRMTQQVIETFARAGLGRQPVEVEAPEGVLVNALIHGEDIVVHLLNQTGMLWQSGESVPFETLYRFDYPPLREPVVIRLGEGGAGGWVDRLDLPGEARERFCVENATVRLEAGTPLVYTLLRFEGAAAAFR